MHEAYHSPNWDKSTPTGYRMSRNGHVFEKERHCILAMQDWQTRVKKENVALGLYMTPGSKGSKYCTSVKKPSLHGWVSVPCLPSVTICDDFVPTLQGPLFRNTSRKGSSYFEHGSFYRTDSDHTFGTAPGGTLAKPAGSTWAPTSHSSAAHPAAGDVMRRLERLEASLGPSAQRARPRCLRPAM
mmetsp:Transcript_1550/g.4567  ORF Transcript_1550/g.4567 Transcript_1550/m.4567 type:complete len:185 (+) Transcript_1550:101-655(+)